MAEKKNLDLVYAKETEAGWGAFDGPAERLLQVLMTHGLIALPIRNMVTAISYFLAYDPKRCGFTAMR